MARYWNTNYTSPLAEDLQLKVSLKIDKGKVVRFSVVLRNKIGPSWYNIKRYDNTKKHDSKPHCHIYKQNGTHHREFIGDEKADLGPMVTDVIKDITKNFKEIVENYKYSK